jgi:membrane dipeptidase
MLIVDAHLDLAMNALQGNRNLSHRVAEIRAVEGADGDIATVSLPELRAGGVFLCLATLIARSTGQPVPHLDFGSPAQAYGVAHGQLAYYQALALLGQGQIIVDWPSLQAHHHRWQTQPTTAPLGLIINMEGADPILSPKHLADWHRAGLRVLALAHYGPGRYAGGTGTTLGLSETGPALLREMARLGIVLDVSHLSDPAFEQALAEFSGPVLASHSNCRALSPKQRQLSDAQLRAIIKRGGVVGIALFDRMLTPAGPVSLGDVARHIDHICQLAGSVRQVGIGSDLDGGFGRARIPTELDTIADLPQLGAILQQQGYSESDVAAILHKNWLDFFERAWA